MNDRPPTESGSVLESSGYLGGRDGVELFYRYWSPEAPKAQVLALHGLAAHGEWFESLSAQLLARDIAVLAPDLRGHGLTRWDLGRLPGPDLLVSDALFWIDRLHAHRPGTPVFLLGSSLGGCLAVAVVGELDRQRRHPSPRGTSPPGERSSGLSGLILLAPAFHPLYLGWGEKGRMAISLVFGRRGGAGTPVGRDLMLTSDRLRMQWLRRDPLALAWLPARTHWNAGQLIRRARQVLYRVRTPILCVQGGQDVVVNAEVNRVLFEKRKETRFLLWEEAGHELALELDVGYLGGALADWVRHRAAQKQEAEFNGGGEVSPN